MIEEINLGSNLDEVRENLANIDYDANSILGYGEDCLTLWALKNHISEIQNTFQDKTNPRIIFYRPSFGRRGGDNSAIFGEFDAIFASSENIYLIESKWDNNSEFRTRTIYIKPVQETRHHIFSWYLQHWHEKYVNNWATFIKEQKSDFHIKFPTKEIAPPDSLLARNIEFILTALQRGYGKIPSEENIKDVLLFFYNKNRSTPPSNVGKGFELVNIDYSQEITGNFINLD